MRSNMKISYVLCFTLLLNSIFGESNAGSSEESGELDNNQSSGNSTQYTASSENSGELDNNSQNIEGRIVGGTDAKLGEIPYIVSIRGQGTHGCGGSIINDKFVLTAAHCVYNWDDNPEIFSVQYGVIKIDKEGPNVLQIKKITIHEDYVHRGNYPNDIAVMETTEPFNFSSNAQPVKLPSPSENPDEETKALLAGWGLDKSRGRQQQFLQEVMLTKFTDEFCSNAIKRYDPEIHICAGVRGGGKGQCTGDSGGPLTIDGTQFGVVSWSVKPCASNGNPGVFTKVAHYIDWIKDKTGA